MPTQTYLALADRDPGETSWSITFPDFPGVTSVAVAAADIPRQAKDALTTAVEDMEQDGEDLPPCIENGVIPSFDRSIYYNPTTLHVPVEIAERSRLRTKQKQGGIFFSEEKVTAHGPDLHRARVRKYGRAQINTY